MAIPQEDELNYEILEDGTIKFVTDEISSPNHVNAEAFMRAVAKLAGGPTTRVRRSDKQSHGHNAVRSGNKQFS